MLNKHWGRFYFLEKILIFAFVTVRPRYKPSQVFRLHPRLVECRRLRHRAILGHATLEKSVFLFWHFSIKLDPLIMNMTLVFGFGASRYCGKHFEVSIIELITPEPCLAAWVSRNFFPGEPGSLAGLWCNQFKKGNF